MEIIDDVFIKPFEVTQFWAANKYKVHARQPRNLVAHLVVDDPTPGIWYFQLSHGENTPFAGDHLQPFMPTRANIFALHQGSAEASKILHAANNTQDYSTHVDSLFSGIRPRHAGVSRNLKDQRYQAELWHVLADDWGIKLPPPNDIGKKTIVLTHREGLPCAAAMEQAVVPIIEALKGPINKVKQSTFNDKGKTFDVIEYRLVDGAMLVQRYDVTDFIDRRLPDLQFSFETLAELAPRNRADKKWWEFWK